MNGFGPSRCGECRNCKQLAKVRERVLACCNPPFSHADQGVLDLWNKELARLPCERERRSVCHKP
jgi:hypothetical protein